MATKSNSSVECEILFEGSGDDISTTGLPDKKNTSTDLNNAESKSSKAASEDYIEMESELEQNKKSLVHMHFKYDETVQKYHCNYCSTKISKEKTGSTGNLSRHLRTKHPEVWEPNHKKMQQKKIDKILSKKAEEEGFSDEGFLKRLVEFIILSDQPFTVVENESFRNLILFSNPRVNIPSARAVKIKIVSLFLKEREELKTLLQSAPGKISFVLDGWGSSNSFAFQGVIAEWIDRNWELQETILDLDILMGHHTGLNLANSFSKLLEEFQITEKVLGVTTDNASNCDTFYTEFMIENGLDFDIENHRVRCLAHIVNLACQDAISHLKKQTVDMNTGIASIPDNSEESSDEEMELSDADGIEIDKCDYANTSIFGRLRKGVVKIRSSVQRREGFRRNCEASLMKHKELVKDNATRWNSTYHMLKRALAFKIPFESTLRSEKKLTRYILSDTEWERVNQIVSFLKPFKEMTMYLSKSQLPTMSLSVLVYTQLYNHLESCTVGNGFTEWIQAAATSAQLNKYYPTSDGLAYIIGTVLDPRCKFTWYEYNPNSFHPDTIKNYRRCLKECWESKYKPKDEQTSSTTSTGQDQKKSKPTKEKPISTKGDLVVKRKTDPKDLFVSQMKKAKKDKRDELKIYLDERAVDPESDSIRLGPLAWWKEHVKQFQNLSKMAMDYMAISGTGIPAERFFSSGPDLLAPRRQSLKPDTIRQCLCLKAWLKQKNREDF